MKAHRLRLRQIITSVCVKSWSKFTEINKRTALEPRHIAVDSDSTSPAAVLALTMIFMKTGDQRMLTMIQEHQNGVRPDLVILKVLANCLIQADWETVHEAQYLTILEDCSKEQIAVNIVRFNSNLISTFETYAAQINYALYWCLPGFGDQICIQ